MIAHDGRETKKCCDLVCHLWIYSPCNLLTYVLLLPHLWQDHWATKLFKGSSKRALETIKRQRYKGRVHLSNIGVDSKLWLSICFHTITTWHDRVFVHGSSPLQYPASHPYHRATMSFSTIGEGRMMPPMNDVYCNILQPKQHWLPKEIADLDSTLQVRLQTGISKPMLF